MATSSATMNAARAGSRLPALQPTTIATLVAAACFLIVGIPAGIAPAAVIGGAAGLVFVTLVLSDVTVGLMCFGLLAFFEDLPGFSGVSAAKVAGTLVALSWLATVAVRSRVRRGFASEFPSIAFIAVLFFGWTVLSVAWAKSPPTALTEVSRWGLNLLLLPIVFTAIRERRHMIWLVVVLVSGATLAAAYGMVFAHSDALAQGTSRLAGAGVDSNYLASLLVSGIVLAIALASISTLHHAARAAAVGAAVLGLVGLIDTVSRGGMLGLGAALVVGILVAGRRHRAGLAVIAGVIALGVVGYYASVASPAARQRILAIQGGDGRVDIWTVGLRMVKAKPVTGVGAGNFANSTIDYLLQPGILQHNAFIVDEPKVAHNMYLEVLADLGIPGLAMFLGLLVSLLACAIRAARIFAELGDRAMETVSRGVFVATMGILATDFFISDQFSKPLWIQLAACPCLLALARHAASQRAPSPT